VPDADDTPGTLLALRHLLGTEAAATVDTFVSETVGTVNIGRIDRVGGIPKPEYSGYIDRPGVRISLGLAWLLSLRNRDGGWPTFCRGWGKLPFDRSGSDLTAHALRALKAWMILGTAARVAGIIDESLNLNATFDGVRVRFPTGFADAINAGLSYLRCQQRPDGSWLPLWFGNQQAPDDINPTYGTARVLAAYRDLGLANDTAAARGVKWLLDNQNDDGGWGGGRGTPSSVEETALAVEVLIDLAPGDAVERGLKYLVERVESGGLHDPTPIGFYFAKLWYFEKMYPIVFSVAALGRAVGSGQWAVGS
jgi:squalene-hopene/tetraprenyl-beta-curcumene cyclase